MCRLWTAILSLLVFSMLQTKVFVDGSKKNANTRDVCEYEIDLKQNTFRAKCRGQPLGINVYATNASVKAAHVSQGTDGSELPNARHWPAYPAPDNVLNTTSLLNDMKQKLTSQKSAITNISSLLSRGDNDLKSDLEALRGLGSGDFSVKESVISTMRNQYNFMRTAILTHNAQLSQMLNLLDSLVRLTSQTTYDTYRSQRVLLQKLAHVNRTMLAMRANCRRKCPKKIKPRKAQCPGQVSAIGRGEALRVPWDQGVVMTDDADSSDRLWIMTVEDGTDQLLQYDTPIDIDYGLVTRYFSLPFYCEGTGHVVYRKSLFCQKAGTRTIAKYNLKRMEVAAEVELPSAGIANTFPYQFGLNSDIDLATDELGLWVIYSTEDSAGKIVISKLNHQSLVIEKTWLTSFPKKLVGNSFMVCGVLYATNSYKDVPTYVRFTYDTNTQRDDAIQEAGKLVFYNAVGFNSSRQASSVMLDYSFKEHKLYSWSNGQIETYPVYFQKGTN